MKRKANPRRRLPRVLRVQIDLDAPYQPQRDKLDAAFEIAYLGGLMRRYDGEKSAVAKASGLSSVYVRKLVKRHRL